MGWSVTLESNKRITESEIQKIIDNLPENMYFCGFEPSRQSWGWSCVNDVMLPEDNCISIGGAYGVSEDTRSDYIKRKLEEYGHVISSSVSY